jgi:hypothetical protein
VRPEAVRLAEEIIRVLPEFLPLPEVSLDPDGEVSLDWWVFDARTFALGVGTSGRLPYAWVDGSDHGCGVTRFDGAELPGRILEEIIRICGNNEHNLAVRPA